MLKTILGSSDTMSSIFPKTHSLVLSILLLQIARLVFLKVEKILKGSLDLIPSRSNDLLLHLSSPQFEFSLKVVGSDPGYLLKSFLL